MSHNKADHTKNYKFEEELDALIKRHLEVKDICVPCMVDILDFYVHELGAANAERALDLMTAGLLRPSGRLT